ncbi:MAG: hypothetical protein SGBAC_006504 [Bacillariaceae sp.]
MCSPKANHGSIENDTPLVGLPTDADIVCGRGRGIWTHPGNLRLKLLIECNLQAYSQAVRRREKSLIINHVLDTMILTGARFVKKERSVWYVIDEKEAREKTAHAIRDFLKRRRQCQDPNKTKPKKRERSKHAQSPAIAVPKPDWTNFEPSVPATSMKRSFSEPPKNLSRNLYDFKASSLDGKQQNTPTLPCVSLPKSSSFSAFSRSDLEPTPILSATASYHAAMPTRVDRNDERLQLSNVESTDPLQNLFGSTCTGEPNLALKSSILDESSEGFNVPDFC